MKLPKLPKLSVPHLPGGGVNISAGLQDNALKFKIIVDNINEGVVLIDNQGVIQLMNPGGGTICGWKPEDTTGINVDQVLKLVGDKGEPMPEAENPLHQIFTSQDKQSIRGKDIFLLTPSDIQTPIALNVSPLLDKNKQVTAAVAVFSNVSKEREQEKQRADFISTASHEMRTPVAAIEGYLALALNEKVSTIDRRARDYLEKAHSSTQHLGELFQDLLTSAKAEDGRLTSNPAVLEIGDFLEQLTSDLRLVAEKKGLAMEFSATNTGNTINATGGDKVIRPLYYVYVDADRLREVITNLFDNAVKYTPEGKVTIGLTGNDKVVQCYVRDTGPGIPAEDLPHLFQKFYRVDNSATRTIGGTGLGLFISRKIIELYNGRIWAESEVNQGSKFYINLPRLSSEDAKAMQTTGAGALIKPISTDVAP